MTKLTLPQFRKVLEAHGFLALTDEPYASCFKALKDAEKKDLRVNAFIAAYCDAYKIRYNYHPRVIGKTAGAAKRLVEELGLETAIQYAEAYLRSNEGFFCTKRHDLFTLEQNLLAVQQMLETGRSVTRAQINQNDRAQANVNAMRDYIAQAEDSDDGRES